MLMYGDGDQPWSEAWQVLGQMTSLKDLSIDLGLEYSHAYEHEEWTKQEATIFEPVKHVTAPRNFIIVLPDRRCSTDLDVGDSKCVFLLPTSLQKMNG